MHGHWSFGPAAHWPPTETMPAVSQGTSWHADGHAGGEGGGGEGGGSGGSGGNGEGGGEGGGGDGGREGEVGGEKSHSGTPPTSQSHTTQRNSGMEVLHRSVPKAAPSES